MALTTEEYLAKVRPAELFARLRVGDPGALASNVAHFTEREAADRDRIVHGYFGDSGAQRITDAIVDGLLAAGAMNPAPALLDIGAGSGFFTERVEAALRAKGLRPRMFAMDATPAMLRALGAKELRVVPFLGLLEDIEGSVREARGVQPLPPLFDGAFSTLALHHCPDPADFFQGAARVLSYGAPLVVVDMMAHNHAEFRETMGDLHLGFEPRRAEALALQRFDRAEARPIEGAICSSSGYDDVGMFALKARR